MAHVNMYTLRIPFEIACPNVSGWCRSNLFRSLLALYMTYNLYNYLKPEILYFTNLYVLFNANITPLYATFYLLTKRCIDV